jgi:hypothetical protein
MNFLSLRCASVDCWRSGRVERDIESAWLSADEPGSGPLDDLLGHSITYRIAVGPRAGQKLFTLQTVPARLHGLEGDHNGAARAGGFSLHAGIDIQPSQRAKLQRLCRYVSRPPVATERPGADLIRPGEMPTQDSVSRRDDAYRDGAAGSDGAPCRTDSATADAPDAL